MYQIVPNKHTLKIIPLFVVMLMLGGCLVDDNADPPPLIERDPVDGDTFIQLESGYFMNYDIVRGQVTLAGGSTQSLNGGSLSVEWTVANIPAPFDDDPDISVLRETTTLRIGVEYVSIRYITQDPDGTIKVVAYPHPNVNSYYRVSPTDDSSNIQEVPIMPSPVPSTGTDDLNLHIFEDCTRPQCGSKILNIFESREYRGDNDTQTNSGRFQTLRINFNNGTLTPTLAGITPIFDIRAACDPERSTFFGYYDVFPEVGIVYFENSCTSNTDQSGFSFSASLRSTNIPIPN
jgi:hypothetical protein